MFQLKAVAAACTLLVLGACGDDSRVVYGESGLLVGSRVTTWARIDNSSDRVLELGATVPVAAIDKAKSAADIHLSFPAEARRGTGFNHIGIDYNPVGHGPQPFMVKHFDLHFYTIDRATQMAINCNNEPMPLVDSVPSPYVVPSTAADPTGTCVPQMGVHAIKPTTFSTNYTFEYELILGYHAGELAFVEPMVTQSALMQRKAFAADVQLPRDRGGVVAWPTRQTMTYDPAVDAYQVVLGDLVYNDDISASEY